MDASDLRAFVQALPKAELHVHLEGSMRPGLLLDLARRRGVELPAGDEAGLRRWFRFEDFAHFIEIYLACSRCLREPEDFQKLLDDFAASQASQNVVYSEVHFTISTHLANGVDGEEVAQALGEAIDRARDQLGVEIRLIPDIVRNIAPAAADLTLEWALAHRDRGVVALGLAGMEGVTVAPFGEHFETARREGLRTTAHAGEQLGPEAMREVLEICRPERLGHGIAAVRDETLLQDLVERRIPLEVCPTSNIRLGYAESLEDHPFDRLRQAGATLTVNSDDPPLFNTTLVDEYCNLASAFGYSRSQLVALARGAFEQAFLSDEDRAACLARFDRSLTPSA